MPSFVFPTQILDHLLNRIGITKLKRINTITKKGRRSTCGLVIYKTKKLNMFKS